MQLGEANQLRVLGVLPHPNARRTKVSQVLGQSLDECLPRGVPKAGRTEDNKQPIDAFIGLLFDSTVRDHLPVLTVSGVVAPDAARGGESFPVCHLISIRRAAVGKYAVSKRENVRPM